MYRLRVDLNHKGMLNSTMQILTPLENSKVKIFWAHEKFRSKYHLRNLHMSSGNKLLRHKTTLRDLYDDAYIFAQNSGGFDCIFLNKEGHVTEGGLISD
jgi:para-aminobenzoate synthetase/4-amino-4-deoxychorismate lyase